MNPPSVHTPVGALGNDGALSQGERRYLKSFLVLRLLVGVVGVGLTFALVYGERLLPGHQPLRGSLSGYYHSGVRDLFVGSLCAIAIFLICYMMFHNVWDNVLSTLAGVAALGVALLPTAGPDPGTPLQRWWGEALVGRLHFACAVVFILSLAAISVLFGYREGIKETSGATRRLWWRSFHWACALLIVLSVVFVAVTKLTGRFDGHSVLYGEAAAAIAFGLSWLAKGSEWRILLAPSIRLDAPEPVPAYAEMVATASVR